MAFELVAKTLMGLEDVLAEELRSLGAASVAPGRRMVSFEGDLEMMYRANVWCRTALCILKPIYKFTAADTDSLYEIVKEYDWGSVLSLNKNFSIDATVNSHVFTHSHFVVYRVKDAIVDWFKDRYGEGKRPKVCVSGEADVKINVHIDGERVTLSLNSSGESLHKRGWRVKQTEAPINEVLAAGIILKSGWRGESPFVDPMCGSGTFLIEAAMIAADIAPGSYRKGWAFENWRDFDSELLERVMALRPRRTEITTKIYGADISPRAISVAEGNVLSAGVDDIVSLRTRSIRQWEEAPGNGTQGIVVTNPPYGERINPEDINDLYRALGTKLKRVFVGWHAWVISSNIDCLNKIGLTPSRSEETQNGGINCLLREYITFEGTKEAFRRQGGVVKSSVGNNDVKPRRQARKTDEQWRRDADKKGLGGKKSERRREPKEETNRPSEAEELLSRRRNVRLLKQISKGPSTPSLPATEGTFMRTRRRWKRPDSQD